MYNARFGILKPEAFCWKAGASNLTTWMLRMLPTRKKCTCQPDMGTLALSTKMRVKLSLEKGWNVELTNIGSWSSTDGDYTSNCNWINQLWECDPSQWRWGFHWCGTFLVDGFNYCFRPALEIEKKLIANDFLTVGLGWNMLEPQIRCSNLWRKGVKWDAADFLLMRVPSKMLSSDIAKVMCAASVRFHRK